MKKSTMTHTEKSNQSPSCRRRTTRGFTVVELLVVVSIIGLLVSLVIPSIGKAREVARRAICQGNLRQLFISVNNYGNENHGFYPGIFGLGQSRYNGDASLSCTYMNSPTWLWPANYGFTQFVDKGITLCPSVDHSFGLKTWTNGGNDVNGIPIMYGTMDYAMKCAYGSNHLGLTATCTDYPDPIPGWYPGENGGAFRGMYDFRFPNARYGYGLNYRQDQPIWWNYAVHSQQTNSIMFMDQERSPETSAQDGTIYELKSSNHPDSGGRAADITNVVEASGRVRAMNMEHVWGEPNYQTLNYYDMSAYGEGNYNEYVDDDIAQNWW
jgi:prepilin-type N-terminal cleavage/methylation domain-containing protein